MTKEIPLSQGLVALVDDVDYEWASKHKWHAHRKPKENTWYARRNTVTWPNRKTLYLHREIMNAPPGIQVDHIDGNGLDCRRANMRLATKADNGRNRGKQSDNTSGFKGVTWNKSARKWVAQIKVNSKNIHLGYHNTAEAAARTYDEAAWKYFGDFARTNFEGVGVAQKVRQALRRELGLEE